MPPSDPRYLNCTDAEMVLDVWAHRHVDDPKLRHEIENPDFDQDVAEWEAEEGIPSASPTETPPDPGDFDDVVF